MKRTKGGYWSGAVASSVQLLSDGGAAVAAGRGGEGGCQGRAAVAQSFSDVGHEEGVVG